SHGVVPVAILSTATFDATAVDPLTVTLAGASVRLKGNGTAQASRQDVNRDGRMDLVVHVNTEALQLTASDTAAVLVGQTYGGETFQGIDSVRVINGLHAAEIGPGAGGAGLTQVQAESMLHYALARWAAAGEAVPAGVRVAVAALPGSLLGMAFGNTITLDDD